MTKFEVKFSKGGDYLFPNEVYAGWVTDIKEITNPFYKEDEDDPIMKNQLSLTIETDGGQKIITSVNKIVARKSQLGYLLSAIEMFTDDITEIDSEEIKEKMFKFTTKKGKELTNQKTGEVMKNKKTGEPLYFAKVDKFYNVDAEIPSPAKTTSTNSF